MLTAQLAQYAKESSRVFAPTRLPSINSQNMQAESYGG